MGDLADEMIDRMIHGIRGIRGTSPSIIVRDGLDDDDIKNDPTQIHTRIEAKLDSWGDSKFSLGCRFKNLGPAARALTENLRGQPGIPQDIVICAENVTYVTGKPYGNIAVSFSGRSADGVIVNVRFFGNPDPQNPRILVFDLNLENRARSFRKLYLEQRVAKITAEVQAHASELFHNVALTSQLVEQIVLRESEKPISKNSTFNHYRRLTRKVITELAWNSIPAHILRQLSDNLDYAGILTAYWINKKQYVKYSIKDESKQRYNIFIDIQNINAVTSHDAILELNRITEKILTTGQAPTTGRRALFFLLRWPANYFENEPHRDIKGEHVWDSLGNYVGIQQFLRG